MTIIDTFQVNLNGFLGGTVTDRIQSYSCIISAPSFHFLGGTLQLNKKTYQLICDVQKKTQAQNLVIPRQMTIIDTFQVNLNGFLGGTPQLKKPLSGNNVNNCSPSRPCAKNNCDTGHNHPDHSRHSSHHLGTVLLR